MAPTARSSRGEPLLPDPHLSLDRAVQITHLAQDGRLPGGGDSPCGGRRMAKHVWGHGGLSTFTMTNLTPRNAKPLPFSHSHSRSS